MIRQKKIHQYQLNTQFSHLILLRKRALYRRKLNHQTSVKQLRQALIHRELPESDHVLSTEEIDQQAQQLEQELKVLSSANE